MDWSGDVGAKITEERTAGMDEEIHQALEQDELIDITTARRKTGSPRRVEIWFHYRDGRLFITGTPGPRDWYANLVADPAFTFHLKQSQQRDIPAITSPILSPARRRKVFDSMRALEPRMGHLVEVELRPPPRAKATSQVEMAQVASV